MSRSCSWSRYFLLMYVSLMEISGASSRSKPIVSSSEKGVCRPRSIWVALGGALEIGGPMPLSGMPLPVTPFSSVM